MSEHEWSTYQCTDDKQHEECLYCPARRIRGVNTNWDWRYTSLGKTACTGAGDPSLQERRVIAEGRDG